MVMDVQSAEELFVALEKFLQRAQKQTLTETSWARKEECLAPVDQFSDVPSLGDIVVSSFTDSMKAVSPDGQLLPCHQNAFAAILAELAHDAVTIIVAGSQHRTERLHRDPVRGRRRPVTPAAP